jgi:rhamnosyltransferase
MQEAQPGAVIISYHPEEDVFENLRLLCLQVRPVVVVDNGSSDAALAKLREASITLSFALIENKQNLGIATALNQGIRALGEKQCDRVFLFDQDSAVTEGYIQTMMNCFSAAPDNLGILVPRYVDRRFGTILAPPIEKTGRMKVATTSGSLMSMAIFDVAGYFVEELFIDGVDYEYSLRIRFLGFSIGECGEAVLLHSPGTPTYHRLLGSKRFQAANYSAVRRYYQERNKVWLAKRYWRNFPAIIASFSAMTVKELLKIILVEDDKLRKVRAMSRGLLDGFRGRMGPCRLR